MRIRCSIYRGGTSKPVFFLEKDLPPEGEERDRGVIKAFGSGDPRQIDGIGGGDPLTSKVAYVRASEREGIDVDYTYGYVGIEEAVIDYKGTCGNTLVAVGPFAIAKGLVKGPVVRILNTNTGKVTIARVEGQRVELTFLDPGGGVTGELLPTGNVRDVVTLRGVGEVEVSMVDAANPFVFIKREDVGEAPLLPLLEELRHVAGEMMGIGYSPGYPKGAVVGPSERYTLEAEATALDKMHKAYAVSGAICTGAAALMEGTVVHDVAHLSGSRVEIGHPSGSIGVDLSFEGGKVESASVVRTARLIMEGEVFIES